MQCRRVVRRRIKRIVFVCVINGCYLYVTYTQFIDVIFGFYVCSCGFVPLCPMAINIFRPSDQEGKVRYGIKVFVFKKLNTNQRLTSLRKLCSKIQKNRKKIELIYGKLSNVFLFRFLPNELKFGTQVCIISNYLSS